MCNSRRMLVITLLIACVLLTVGGTGPLSIPPPPPPPLPLLAHPHHSLAAPTSRGVGQPRVNQEEEKVKAVDHFATAPLLFRQSSSSPNQEETVKSDIHSIAAASPLRLRRRSSSNNQEETGKAVDHFATAPLLFRRSNSGVNASESRTTTHLDKRLSPVVYRNGMGEGPIAAADVRRSLGRSAISELGNFAQSSAVALGLQHAVTNVGTLRLRVARDVTSAPAEAPEGSSDRLSPPDNCTEYKSPSSTQSLNASSNAEHFFDRKQISSTSSHEEGERPLFITSSKGDDLTVSDDETPSLPPRDAYREQQVWDEDGDDEKVVEEGKDHGNRERSDESIIKTVQEQNGTVKKKTEELEKKISNRFVEQIVTAKSTVKVEYHVTSETDVNYEEHFSGFKTNDDVRSISFADDRENPKKKLESVFGAISTSDHHRHRFDNSKPKDKISSEGVDARVDSSKKEHPDLPSGKINTYYPFMDGILRDRMEIEVKDAPALPHPTSNSILRLPISYSTMSVDSFGEFYHMPTKMPFSSNGEINKDDPWMREKKKSSQQNKPHPSLQRDSGSVDVISSMTSPPATVSKDNSYADFEFFGSSKQQKSNRSSESDVFDKDDSKYPTNNKRGSKNGSTTGKVPLPLTTPDPDMKDQPYNRGGPNAFPEVDHFPKDNKEQVPKKLPEHLDPVVEVPNFPLVNNPHLDWKRAKQEWGIAWECHCYIMGSLFVIVGVYSFISLLRLKTFVRLLSKGYFIALNIIILVMCSTRGFYLLFDPYNSSHQYPVILSQFAYNMTLPCLTSTFSVLFLALLQSTKTQLLSPKFQKPSLLACIVTFHFSFSITCDVIVGVFVGATLLLLVCQIMFLVWAATLSSSYFYIFKKLHHAALRKQGEMIRITFTKMHIDGAQLPKKLPKPTLGLAVKMTLATAVLDLVFCTLQMYGIVFVQGIFPKQKPPEPWLWWGYQLTCRILELTLCVSMSFVATQPLKHFEVGDNRFCNIIMWFPCSSFAECCHKPEVYDFEVHSDNYANLQGFRNCGFTFQANSRRLQTNSLPTFRTASADVDNTLPMRNLPYAGRGKNTNHPSALSLLSYYRSKRNLSLSTNDGLDDLERTIGNQATLSSVSEGRNNTIRPASMLYKDNGFIRFRTDNDPEQPMELSDEDNEDRIREEEDTSMEDGDSTKANVGSSFHSLLEDDIVQSTLSPFFQIGYNRRFRKMSRVSIETTDNSVDVSSEQLSNVTFRNGLSNSALDFNIRKYGSTCSSESAANSFDVTFFLNGNSAPTTSATTPGSQQSTSVYKSETEEDKTSSVEGHEVMLRSVSPIVTRAVAAAARRMHELPLNLNLPRPDSSLQGGHVNVACGTEDITPDSAVYLDLQLSREIPSAPVASSSFHPPLPICLPLPPPPLLSFTDSQTPSSEDTSPESGTPISAGPKTSSNVTTATSQSMSDLRTSNSYVVVSRARRPRGLLNKLRGSTFSLNAAINGYEPLEPEDGLYYFPNGHQNHQTKRKLRRASSDRRPGSAAQVEEQPAMTSLGDFRDRSVTTSMAHLGDSGLLGDCQDCGVTLVDVASQTEPSDAHVAVMTSACDIYCGIVDCSPRSAASGGIVDLGK